MVTATSGREALRHLLKDEFAVILLDVFMPGMDGYETASLIREREQTARIPIIFLSAVNKETEHLMRGYAMGAVDYVFKPVDPLVLKSKVGVFVDLYNMRVQVEETEPRRAGAARGQFPGRAGRGCRSPANSGSSREREAAILQSLPILLYMEPAGGRAAPSRFRQRRLAGDDRIRVRGGAGRSAFVGATASSGRPRASARRHARTREATGRLSIEYRWQCADGAYKHFLDQAVLVKDRGGGTPNSPGR